MLTYKHYYYIITISSEGGLCLGKESPVFLLGSHNPPANKIPKEGLHLYFFFLAQARIRLNTPTRDMRPF